jgi:hypothetical protein
MESSGVGRLDQMGGDIIDAVGAADARAVAEPSAHGHAWQDLGRRIAMCRQALELLQTLARRRHAKEGA